MFAFRCLSKIITTVCFIIVSKEAQIAAIDISISYPRSLAVEFTMPFSYDPLILIIPYPELDSTINRIAKPFQYEVSLQTGLLMFLHSIFEGLK